jgi:predicted RNA binding protein YcfA (HicA-like mRNA interferase family)
MIAPDLLEQLRNVPIREIVSALERDGFTYRSGKGSSRVYRHPDGRRTVVHYHRGSDTLPLGTLRKVIEGAGWSDGDLRRLRLVR